MELRNGGGQCRSYFRIGTTLAVAAAIALIAGCQPNEAKAADGTTDVTVQVAEGDENLAWSVPTKIPMKATAAGTLISPDADAIAIRNLSAFPIRVKQMDTTAEAPFNLVDDVNKSSGNNDFQMSMNGTAVKQTVELPDDGTWAMGYTGNENGSDKLPITISDAKIARVTANLSAAKKAATITWTAEPTEYVNAAVHAAVTKDAKDWTLDEQKTVAEDISANGETSPAYAKAKAAMDAETTWSIQLTDGSTLEYRIIGINHDDLADGTGKAGLTFEATGEGLGYQRMNATNTNVGGWEKSELRSRLNSGDLWSLLPTEIQSKAKAVTKMTDNKGSTTNMGNGSVGTPSGTTDKVFLLSPTELYGDMYFDGRHSTSDGKQYELYKTKVTSHGSGDPYLTNVFQWLRTVSYAYNSLGQPWYFCTVYYGGYCSESAATNTVPVKPAFCF